MVDLGATIGGLGMPGVTSYTAQVPQVNHGKAAVFIDNIGHVYNGTTGAFISTGGEPLAEVDPAFGYYRVAGAEYLLFAGASPSYHDLRIGDNALTTGYQGESYYTNNTVLCIGMSGALCGAEHANSGGDSDTRWSINIRDSAFALLASDPANYIHDWMVAHPNTFHLNTFGSDEDYDVHISPDPEDGSFWVNLLGGPTWGGDPAPVFNVSATDGSLINTVELAAASVPTGFQRVHRIIPA
jgi:hypothetical protein